MEGFKTFTQAMDMASLNCRKWKDIEEGSICDYDEMMEIAAYLDGAFPLVGHLWYVVFDDGEIGLLSQDNEEISRMFLPYKEDETEYCMYCGSRLAKEAVYCPKCGKKVR